MQQQMIKWLFNFMNTCKWLCYNVYVSSMTWDKNNNDSYYQVMHIMSSSKYMYTNIGLNDAISQYY